MSKKRILLLVTGILAVLVAVAFYIYDQGIYTFLSPHVVRLESEEAKDLLNEKDLLILDAREDEEFRTSHLQGALHYDPAILDTIPKNQALLIYCTIGVRSNREAQKASEKGFQQIYEMKDGIIGWANASFQLIDQDGQTTDSVHTYNKSFSPLLKKGTAVY